MKLLHRIEKWLPVVTRLKVIYHLYSARRYADRIYFKHFGRRINWRDPTEFNEKIRVLQFYGDTALWTLLADKYAVRSYIAQKGLQEILVKLYARWNSVNDVDLSTLPTSFVIKKNNGCGDVIIVRDKSNVNVEDIKKQVDNALHSVYGLHSGESHYATIKPCIVVEELLENDTDFSNCIVDYKFYCFDGEPYICGVYYDRIPNSHETNSTFYDMDWVKHSEWRKPSLTAESKDIPRPKNFDKMKEICRILCKSIPFVRLDVYEVKGNVYFGEFTFTPAACCGGSLNPSIFNELGSRIKLSR